MATDTHESNENATKEAEVRARVPDWMKGGVETLAAGRLLRDADIVREALAEYLQRRNITKPQNKSEEVAA